MHSEVTAPPPSVLRRGMGIYRQSVLLDHRADPTIKFRGEAALQLARKAMRAAATREETRTYEVLVAKLVEAGKDWRIQKVLRHTGAD